MTGSHAVVPGDHKSAEVLQFDTEHLQLQKVKARTRRHDSAVCT